MSKWLHAIVNTGHKQFQIENQQLWTYCAHDVDKTGQIWPKLVETMKELGLYDWYLGHFWPFTLAVCAMQSRGIAVSTAALTAFRADTTRELEETETHIEEWLKAHAPTVGKINLDSGPQLATLLFGGLGLRSPKLTKGGRRAVDQDTLLRVHRDLRKKDEHCRP